jgi:hypothetical protein
VQDQQKGQARLHFEGGEHRANLAFWLYVSTITTLFAVGSVVTALGLEPFALGLR